MDLDYLLKLVTASRDEAETLNGDGPEYAKLLAYIDDSIHESIAERDQLRDRNTELERERDAARAVRDRARASERRTLAATEEFCRRQSLTHIRRDDLANMKTQLASAIAERDEALANGVLSQRVCDIENERVQAVADRDEWKKKAEQAEADRMVLGVQLDGMNNQINEAIRRWQETEAKFTQVAKERDELHAELKAVVDYAIDIVGMPVSTMLGKHAPVKTMRKLHADLNHAISENLAFNVKVSTEINEARTQRDAEAVRADRIEAIARHQSKLLAELPPSADQLIAAEMAAAVARTERDAAITNYRNVADALLSSDAGPADLVAEARRLRSAYAQIINEAHTAPPTRGIK